MLEIISILIFIYFGTGLLFVMHVGLTHYAMTKVQVTWETSDHDFDDAVNWFIFIDEQRGGVWGLMGRLLVNPFHFVRIAKEINQ